MKLTQRNQFASTSLIKLKDDNWLSKQRIAGKVVAKTLHLLESLVEEKTNKSLLELDAIAEEFILSNDCIPTFKNYKGHGSIGFPNSVCISVNQQLVHGIATDYKLQNGDVVSFDLGATYKGAIADSALTCIWGTPKSNLHTKVISATEESLMKGINSMAVGKKIGCIGYAISRCAKGYGFNVINNYGGHGLDWDTPHASPFIANKSEAEVGIHIVPGLSIAIEPMLVDGSTETYTDADGWTVWCKSNISAHFEHSVYVHDDYIEIVTSRDNL